MTDHVAAAGLAVVRERTSTDMPRAAAALVEVHASDGYPVEGVADPQAWLTSSVMIRAWVAELDGRIVGHVAVTRPQPGDAAAVMWTDISGTDANDVGVLGRLFVVADARRHAVGDRLMKAATDYADQRGLRLVLDVMTKDASAIRLYERLGWQKIGTTDHDDGHGAYVPAYCFVSPSPESELVNP